MRFSLFVVTHFSSTLAAQQIAADSDLQFKAAAEIPDASEPQTLTPWNSGDERFREQPAGTARISSIATEKSNKGLKRRSRRESMQAGAGSKWLMLAGLVLPAAFGCKVMAQQASLPDAPAPQVEVALAAEDHAQNQQPDQQPAQTPPPAPAQNGTGQSGSSTSQTNSQSGSQSEQQAETQESQRQKAQKQLEQQKQQRILGIVPNFNTSYVNNAVSLTGGQKMKLAFASAIDPFTFAAAFMVAGLHEGLNEDPGFGWGAEGYFKRSGAAYLDSFNGTMIGNGILPSILHQDPRYFRLGHGSTSHRLFYAIATSYVAKHDNTGKWEPNYSNIGGNIIAGAISNLYYPSQNSGWGQTITNGLIVTTEGTIGGVFNEFWPDLSRKFLHKDPTHGLDAQAQEEYKASQEAKKKKQPVEPAPKM
jgi:hypothetical protein